MFLRCVDLLDIMHQKRLLEVCARHFDIMREYQCYLHEGFCYLNNAAIATQYIIDKTPKKVGESAARVCIFDVD